MLLSASEYLGHALGSALDLDQSRFSLRGRTIEDRTLDNLWFFASLIATAVAGGGLLYVIFAL